MEANGSELSAAVVCAAVGAEHAGYWAHGHDVSFASGDHVGKEGFYRLEQN